MLEEDVFSGDIIADAALSTYGCRNFINKIANISLNYWPTVSRSKLKEYVPLWATRF